MKNTTLKLTHDLLELVTKLSHVLDKNSLAWCLASLLYQKSIPEVSEDFFQTLKLERSVFENINAEYKKIQSLKKLSGIPGFVRMSPHVNLSKELALLAHDDETLAILQNGFQKLWKNTTQWSHQVIHLKLRFPHSIKLLTLPDTAHTFASILELLIEKNYAHKPTAVTTIFDLGTNLGISACFLHDLYPAAHIVCVEPCTETFNFLKQNLSQNNIKATLLNGAVSTEKGEAVLYKHRAGNLLHSIAFNNPVEYTSHTKVKTFTINELIPLARKNSFGIKLDIEGCEHSLVDTKNLLKQASWIVGELHYGSFYAQKGFESFLLQHFNVSVKNPNCSLDAFKQLKISQDFSAIQ